MKFFLLSLVALVFFSAGSALAQYENADLVYDPVVKYEHYFEAEVKKEDEVVGLPQLDPTYYPSQIFWLLVIFGTMYTVFRFRVLPDLSNTIERRREQVDGDLTAARNLKDEAERIHAEYEDALTEARKKSSALFTRVEDKIKEKEQEEFAAFHDRSIKTVVDAEKTIAKAKDKAIDDMSEHAADIALLAAGKIIDVKATKKQVTSVVNALQNKKAA